MIKRVIFCNILLFVTMCFCCFTPQPGKQVSEMMAINGDTVFIGKFHRSKYTSLVHLYLKNNEGTDLRINDININDWRIEISSSPLISVGAKGTIVLILDTEKMREGIQQKNVKIKTNSKTNPEIDFYIKYEILPYEDPN